MTDSQPDDDAPSPEQLYQELEVFEPYTTDELAAEFRAERSIIKRLLGALNREGKIRKKKPADGNTIWIREPPKHRCPNCEYEFEIKYLHPVFSAVQYCPRCGAHLQ